MNDEKKYTEKELNEWWRKGYDLGVQKTLQDNSAAMKIGNVILEVLDNRYEFAKEDY